MQSARNIACNMMTVVGFRALPPEHFRLQQTTVSSSASAPCVDHLPLTVLTFNVLSLKGWEKRKLVHAQIQAMGCHIVGLQETRAKALQVKCQGSYLTIASPANEAGNYGVELWINTKLPFARLSGKPVCINRNAVTVLAFDPRFLFVSLCNNVVSVLCVVAHAPHSGDMNLSGWWNHFAGLCDRFRGSFHSTLVFIDANAQLGHVVSDATGGHAVGTASKTTATGEHLLAWAIHAHLRIPSTFSECCSHESDQSTFDLKDGVGSVRIDYLACCCNVHVLPGTSRVQRDFVRPDDAIDHWPVSLVIQLRCTFSGTSVSRKGVCYRKHLVQDPLRQPIFCDHLDTCPLVPWDIEPSSHLAILNAHVREGAERIFGGPRCKNSSCALSMPTLECISLARKHARISLGALRRIRQAPLFAAFVAWKHRRFFMRYSMVFACARPSDAASYIWHLLCHRFLSASSKRRVRLDKLAHYDRLAEQCDSALNSGNTQAMHRAVADFCHATKRSTKPCVRIVDEHGLPALSYLHERTIVRQHFAGVLAGSVKDMSQLVTEERAFGASRKLKHHVDILSSTCPTLRHLSSMFFRAPSNKMCGEDKIGGDLLHVFHRHLA